MLSVVVIRTQRLVSPGSKPRPTWACVMPSSVSKGMKWNELRRMLRRPPLEPRISGRGPWALISRSQQGLDAPTRARRPCPCGPSRCRDARRSRRCVRGSWRSRGRTWKKSSDASSASAVVSTVRQQVGLAHALAGGAADDHLPAALDADEADILDRRFRTVARTADGAPSSPCAA